MITKQFIVTINVDDENISELYPNYSINYDSPDELIEALMKSFKWEGVTDMSKGGLREWGYSKDYKLIGENE